MASNRIEQLNLIQEEAKELFRRKNADYGDAFALYGTVGILVRIGDKIRRLQNINSKGITLVNDEKLRDTLIDLHNYAAMGIMTMDSSNLEDVSEAVNEDENEYENEDESEDESEDEKSSNNKKFQNQYIDTTVVKGSKNNEYAIKKFKNNAGHIYYTCSCPSYYYCTTLPKTCKHIDKFCKHNIGNID